MSDETKPSVVDLRDDEPQPPVERVAPARPARPHARPLQRRSVDEELIELMDQRSAEAASLLGRQVYVDLAICRLPDGGLQVRWSIGKEHSDGYKLQELGQGSTFYEAVVEASKDQELRTPLRPRTDAQGRAMQDANARRQQESQVRGEVAKLHGGR